MWLAISVAFLLLLSISFSSVNAVIVTPEEQEKLWDRWQKQDKTVTDTVKQLHMQYDRNDTIQAIVSFAEPMALSAFENMIAAHDLKLQSFDFSFADGSGGSGSNKIHDFGNLSKVIEEYEELLEKESTGIRSMIANGTVGDYKMLLTADVADTTEDIRKPAIQEFQVLRQIDENMLEGEELKLKLERANDLISNMSETMYEKIPWTLVGVRHPDWYLIVTIDDRVATEPEEVYLDRLKKLVGEDIPIDVSFGHIELA